MKRSPMRRLTWQQVQSRGAQCDVRGCKRKPDEGEKLCVVHLSRYQFELNKLGELAPARVVPDQIRSERKPTGQWIRAQQKWRKACLEVRSYRCIAESLGDCSSCTEFEADHIWPRAHGGPYVVENCAFVCHHHHAQKTNSELRYRREWLEPDQVRWLASVGWVTWGGDGQPFGRGMRHFEPVRPSATV